MTHQASGSYFFNPDTLHKTPNLIDYHLKVLRAKIICEPFANAPLAMGCRKGDEKKYFLDLKNPPLLGHNHPLEIKFSHLKGSEPAKLITPSKWDPLNFYALKTPPSQIELKNLDTSILTSLSEEICYKVKENLYLLVSLSSHHHFQDMARAHTQFLNSMLAYLADDLISAPNGRLKSLEESINNHFSSFNPTSLVVEISDSQKKVHHFLLKQGILTLSHQDKTCCSFPLAVLQSDIEYVANTLNRFEEE